MTKQIGKTHTQYRHGGYVIHKPEYSVWKGMKNRCYNPNSRNYHRYGGRGIKVCDRWLGDDGFSNFLNDIGKRPNGYTIERVDYDGDYAPENCEWIPASEQSRNRSTVIWLTIDGVKDTFSGQCRRFGINKSIAHNRHKRGWDMEKSITTPLNPVGYSPNKTSKYIGVFKDPRYYLRNRFVCSVCTDNRTIKIGRFKTQEEAAYVYDQVAKQLGKNKTNFEYV